jgi:hypothetical protein
MVRTSLATASDEGEFYLLRRDKPLGKTLIWGPYETQQAAEAEMTGGAADEFVVRRVRGEAPSGAGEYCYGKRLRERAGWQMYLGEDAGGGERWELITDVQFQRGDALLTVEDGTTYRAAYDQAVRCRRPPARTNVPSP